MNYGERVEEAIRKYDLSHVTCRDMPLFKRYFGMYKRPISNMCFADVYMWADKYSYFWKEYGDSLLVYSFSGGRPSLLFPPLGKSHNEEALKEAREIFSMVGERQLAIEYVTEEQLVQLPEITPKSRSGDYVYLTEKMINLDGTELHSQRNRKNAFLKRYNWRTDTYSEKYKDGCAGLMDSIRINNGQPNKKFICELEAARRVLDCPERLDAEGMVVLVDGTVAGFTFGTRLNGDMCGILVEKTNKKYIGSAQFIFSEFCKRWGDTKWCNTGDDWEIPSLMTAKESYRPIRREKKWSALM